MTSAIPKHAEVQPSAPATLSVGATLLRLLSRETSSGNFVPEIDGVRFVAISSVILFHLWGNFAHYAAGQIAIPASFDFPSQVLRRCEVGVNLFFVLSGFILGLPFARQYLLGERAISLKKYFTRRLTRLEPPYVLNLLILLLLLSLTKPLADAFELLSNFLASVCYLHNVIFGSASAINTVAWSLEIEVQFYLAVPLLAQVFRLQPRLRRGLLLGSMVAASLVSEFIFKHGVFSLTLAGSLQYFLAGFLLADIYLAYWNQQPAKALWFDFVTLLALVGLFSVRVFLPRLGMLPIPWLALLVVMGSFRGTLFNRFFTSPWIYTVGGMCYTIYLYHFQIIAVFGHGRLILFHSFYPDLILSCLVMVTVVLAVSSILFILFEKPFMRRDWHIGLLNLHRRPARLSPVKKPM